MKTYTYVNDLGRKKEFNLHTELKENGKYPFSIWDVATGEYCGSGKCTKEEIVNFFNHYGITPEF